MAAASAAAGPHDVVERILSATASLEGERELVTVVAEQTYAQKRVHLEA